MNNYLQYFFKKEIFNHSIDWALVVLRIIPSFYLFYYHGIRKIMGGSDSWEWLGGAALSVIGIKFGYIFFGFLAAFSEGILTWFIIMGFFTRISCIFIIITMCFAGVYHLVDGESAELAFIYLTIYIVIFILGPGKYSLDDGIK